jgi:hypothetical protein
MDDGAYPNPSEGCARFIAQLDELSRHAKLVVDDLRRERAKNRLEQMEIANRELRRLLGEAQAISNLLDSVLRFHIGNRRRK